MDAVLGVTEFGAITIGAAAGERGGGLGDVVVELLSAACGAGAGGNTRTTDRLHR